MQLKLYCNLMKNSWVQHLSIKLLSKFNILFRLERKTLYLNFMQPL